MSCTEDEVKAMAVVGVPLHRYLELRADNAVEYAEPFQPDQQLGSIVNTHFVASVSQHECLEPPIPATNRISSAIATQPSGGANPYGISRAAPDQNGTSTNPSGAFARRNSGRDQTLRRRDQPTRRDIATLEPKHSRNFGAIHGSTAARHRILAPTITPVRQGETI